jgi:superfamily II DNA or RNA helicase
MSRGRGPGTGRSLPKVLSADNPAVPVDALLASLGPGGRDFERLCQWLLENGPEYRSTLKQVWLWDDWPGRSSQDIGIDLVAEDREGGLWAVQAKHYDPTYTIKKADIDSFLSASSRAEFAYRLLIATTDHVGQNARNTIAVQEKSVGMLLRSQLDALEVGWPTSVVKLRPVKPKRKRPRPHQRRAIKDCAEGLMAADRGQLVMACGTGKTLVGSFLAERLAARRVLVLVPSLSLLGQTLREWATAIEFDYLAVCSDETVTKYEQDAVVASTSELGIPVTTDSERIARFLRRRGGEMKVVFGTYQSSPQIATAQANGVPAFDLVIADEAHRCAGPQAGVFATVLDPKKIRARKRVFMTATPRYFTGRVKKEALEADWEVASMDEEATFGRILHRLPFAQAIDQDLLSDYQVVVVGVSDREARSLAERGAFVSADGESVTDARTLARQIGLLRSMAKYDLHRVVTFHSRVDFASRFASSLPETKAWLPARRRPKGTLWVEYVSGKMSAGERDARLRRLKAVKGDERGVLTNARCLTEGVDVPTLDGVAFIDPRRSQVDVVQAVGRAIRRAEDKTVGSIVIPVLVDEDADPEEALGTGEFDRVWQVVRALRDHDADLAAELDELRRGQGLRGSVGKRPGKIMLDLPVAIGTTFATAFDAKLVERSTRRWEYMFGVLERYAAQFGTAQPPEDWKENGEGLGHWVGTQRQYRRRGLLTVRQQGLLEALPHWSWNVSASRWEKAFAIMIAYTSRVGHASPPALWIEGAFKLGRWASKQRAAYAAERLPRGRIRQLESLPGWVWTAVPDAWTEGYESLVRFTKREGSARPPSSWVESGFRLGRWVVRHRRLHRRGKLTEDRARLLESLPGWVWNSKDAVWMEHFEALRSFAERKGHTRPHALWREGSIRLGQWVTVQRSFRRRGMMSPERATKLEALPGWTWEPYMADWKAGLDALREYVSESGVAQLSAKSVRSGFRLGAWVSERRSEYKRGTLAEDKVRVLEAFPGWSWEPQKGKWTVLFRALETYCRREGHAAPPYSHLEDGMRLGAWVYRQREAQSNKQLAPDRGARLEALPGWTWDTREKK